MATFEALYGRHSQYPIGWFKPPRSSCGTVLLCDPLDIVLVKQYRFRVAQSR